MVQTGESSGSYTHNTYEGRAEAESTRQITTLEAAQSEGHSSWHEWACSSVLHMSFTGTAHSARYSRAGTVCMT